MESRDLWVRGGIAGIVGTSCYVLATTLPWSQTRLGTAVALVVASAWPILSIVYCYGLYSFVAAERDGTANRLAFVFAVAAFTTVLAMLLVQLAVGAGVREIAQGLDEPTTVALRRGLRLVDHGLDVAWDFLIGVALILSGVAILRRSGLGPGWAIPSIALGVLLIALNAATFPWPPADEGLVDIGPLIGIFVIALAGRLTVMGWRALRQAHARPR